MKMLRLPQLIIIFTWLILTTDSSENTNPNDIGRLSLSSSVTNDDDLELEEINKTEPNNYDDSLSNSINRKKIDLKLQKNDEKRLLDALMDGYDRDVRPVRNASHPITIQLGITLTQIFDMDEKNQVLTTNVWLDQEWVDELLYWDPVQYNGLQTIRLPCERIWLPDIVLYNNADDYTRGYMKSRAMVSFQGKVFWPPPTKFRSTCPVDVTYFPFDDQTCILKLGSWIYDGFQVDVTNRTAEVDLSNYIPNGEWELLDAGIVRSVIYYSCCPEPFPDVTITITIRRKTLYYMYNVVLPCMMMSVLTLLVFCLPPDSGEKIALGVTVLLAFSVFMLAIAEKMPETSESIPLIGIYLTCVMTITSISIIMTVIVLNCHYRGPIQKQVPPWMKKYFLNSNVVRNMISGNVKSHLKDATQSKKAGGKKWLNLKTLRHRNSNSAPFPPSVEEVNGPRVVTSGVFNDYGNNVLRDHNAKPDTIRLTVDAIGDELKENFPSDLLNSSAEDSNGLHVSWKEFADEAIRKNLSNSAHSPINVGMSSPMRAQDEILKSLRILLRKYEREETEKKRLNEWRTIAIAIDRILFWLFFLVTTISSIVFLVILPLVKRAAYERNT